MKNVLFLLLIAFCCFSCKKSQVVPEPALPTLATAELTNVTTSAASGGGTVQSDGGTPVTSRGVCYGTSPNPTIAGSHTTDGSGTGSFSSSITGVMLRGFTLYARAYAINSAGIAYGNEVRFLAGGGLVYMVGTLVTGDTRYAVIWMPLGHGIETFLTTGSTSDDA